MKSTTFISAFLASAALAQGSGILFAAKVNGQLRRLYGQSVDDEYVVLGFGHPYMAQPFHLDGKLAYTGTFENRSFVGQVDSKWMGFGQEDATKPFEFDENNKVINENFYACAGLADGPDHVTCTFTRISFDANGQSGCTPVDIYKIPLLL